MLFSDSRVASSRVAAVSWCDRAGSFTRLWVMSLLLLNIVCEVGERLRKASEGICSGNDEVRTSSPFRLSCNDCFMREAILDQIELLFNKE